MMPSGTPFRRKPWRLAEKVMQFFWERWEARNGITCRGIGGLKQGFWDFVEVLDSLPIYVLPF